MPLTVTLWCYRISVTPRGNLQWNVVFAQVSSVPQEDPGAPLTNDRTRGMCRDEANFDFAYDGFGLSEYVICESRKLG